METEVLDWRDNLSMVGAMLVLLQVEQAVALSGFGYGCVHEQVHGSEASGPPPHPWGCPGSLQASSRANRHATTRRYRHLRAIAIQATERLLYQPLDRGFPEPSFCCCCGRSPKDSSCWLII
jgi:hypothetical protein